MEIEFIRTRTVVYRYVYAQRRFSTKGLNSNGIVAAEDYHTVGIYNKICAYQFRRVRCEAVYTMTDA